ncbi:MAG: hypothetical protein QOD75_3832 [Blastocatellia bacterium]|jgi:hypothetical protein|nr:hypothetical protein [Blastocatellia bacterium]
MLKPTIQTMLAAAKRLWQQPGMLAVFATLYAVLLAMLYAFAMVSEATFAQVLLTLLLMLAASLEFMMLQAAIIDNAQNGAINWPRILRNSLRLAKVTLPVIIFSVALFLGLNRWESGFAAPSASPQGLHLPALLFSTLRWLLFGITLPLATIHLWLHTTGQIGGEKTSILRRGRTVLSSAFTPASVFTYTIGLVLFALVPYAILFLQLPLKGARTDFPILIGRLVLVFLTTLCGWVLTVTASAQNVVATDTVDGEDAAVKFKGQVHRRSQFV